MDSTVSQLSPQQVLAHWPATFKPRVRDWFAQNVINGQVTDGHAVLRFDAGSKPIFHVGFDFKNGALRYIKSLPVMRNAVGRMTITNDRLIAVVDRAQVTAPQGGRIDVTGATFEINDLKARPAPAEISVQTNSTITAALAILDEKPFEFLTKANQPVDLADGQALMSIDLALPLKRGLTIQDVNFDVRGDLRNMRTSRLIKNRLLAAANLQVTATPTQLTVGGRARLGQVPVDAVWTQPLGPGSDQAGSRVEGTLELSERFIDEFGIALPAGSVRGTGQGDFTLQINRDQPVRFLMSSDLQGMDLQLRDIGWTKRANQAGQFAISGALGVPARIDAVEISGGGLQAAGSVELNETGGMRTAQFSQVRVGEWLDAPVTLNGRGAGRAPEVVINGGRIDLRKTTFGDGGGTGQGGPMQLELDEMIVSDSIRLSEFRGAFSAEGAFNGQFTGRVNGQTLVRGLLAPSETGTAIRIRSDDAGGVLRSAGVLSQARGGDFDMTLWPARREGTYNGRLAVADTRIHNAPALASILSAVSIVGLLDQMANSGILFSDVQARFALTPNQVILTESSAVGPAIGLSMDGTYNFNSGQMDMQGVLSPIYMVNSIGSVLTRRGEGLIGFNFNLRGTASDPRVAVNPLSALTPGMFREIFRRPPPSVSQ
nr:DUF3971 domain-containing protein [Pseudaestuariivita rosea]